MCLTASLFQKQSSIYFSYFTGKTITKIWKKIVTVFETVTLLNSFYFRIIIQKLFHQNVSEWQLNLNPWSNMKIFLAAFLIIILKRTMIQIVVNCLLMKNVVKTQVNKNKKCDYLALISLPLCMEIFLFYIKQEKMAYT